MPELPEVEVIARGLDRTLQGRTVVRATHVELTRLSDPAAELVPRIEGRTIARVHRRAKVLLMDLDNGWTLAFHLKMTGRVVHGPERAPNAHDRLLLLLDDGTQLSFSDMRRFGYVRAFPPGELMHWDFLRKVGPEPLDTDPAELAGRIGCKGGCLKGRLLDQCVVAGIGNIYADESLFRAGLHPQARADQVEPERLRTLCCELQAVLRQAIAENGSSIRDYVNANGDAGAFQNSFYVYGRKGEPCRTCGTPLEALRVAGRTSTFCPHCQPRGRGKR